LLGRIVCLDPDGREVDKSCDRGEDPRPVDDADLRKRALTGMRRYMGAKTNGRVLLGGKRHGFQGEIPGLMEEALISLDNAQPLYLAGGFGGVTADIAQGSGSTTATGFLADPTHPPMIRDGRKAANASPNGRRKLMGPV
jgi:hypothetical protein